MALINGEKSEEVEGSRKGGGRPEMKRDGDRQRGCHILQWQCLFCCTKKCRFMDKRVREISRFFVVQPRVFPLSVRARPRTVLSTNTSSLVDIRPEK